MKKTTSKKTIYIGCSLTHAPVEFSKGIEKLKSELRKKHIILDFLGLEKGTAQDVFENDTGHVRNCDLFVAECSHPSTGLGYEIGTALSLNKPILAVAHDGAKVTRIILGVTHPQFTFKRYDNMNEISDFVEEKLASL